MTLPPIAPSARLLPGSWPKQARTAAPPIAALFFLEKGPENRIDEISSAEAVRRLMRNILFFAEDPGLGGKASGHARAISLREFPFAA